MKFSLIAAICFCGAAFAQDQKPAAPATEAAPAGAATELKLGVIPAVMKFDKTELTVKAGEKVKLTFINEKDPLMHNFLLVKAGKKDAVGAAADAMLADPQAMAKFYIPASDDILAKSTKLVALGQQDVIEFTAPTEPGDYPYICTFPGHWRLMQGVLKVTK